MTATAAVLFATFLPLLARDIYRLLLIGIIFGVLCNKLTDLMARMIDPTDYTRFQAIAYARFDSARADLILPAALIACATLVIGQTLFERVFHYTATLSILIEGIGGIVFLYLLLARKQP